jgi:hypothetical protein
VNGAQVGGPALFGVLIWLLFVRFVVPVLGVFYGTSLIADEVDDKTITYLFTRPVPRASVLLGKYLAYLACVVMLLLPAIVIIYFLVVPIGGSIGQGFPLLAADLGMVAVGVAAYGAVFAFVGAWLKRPLIVGLVFAFGWEQTVLLIPGYLKRLTVASYLQALVPHTMPQESALSMLMTAFQDLPPVWVSLLCLTGITLLALWMGGKAVENRESSTITSCSSSTTRGRPMTNKTRYFAVVSLLVVSVGPGTGWSPTSVPTSAFVSSGGPEELRYLPSTSTVVAFADVREVMTSELRQRFRESVLQGAQENGQREFQEQTGINIETDIDRVVAGLDVTSGGTANFNGSGIVLARGRFDEVRIEALMREHGAQVDAYKGKRLITTEAKIPPPL